MPRIAIFTSRSKTHTLEYNSKSRDLFLVANGLDLVKAKFGYDSSDGASVLSQFECIDGSSSQYVRIMADTVSDYLSSKQDRCKLFCIPKSFVNQFTGSQDYRSTDIDRLMLRESHANVSMKMPDDSIKFEKLTVVNEEEQNQLLSLLQQTYWAKDADLDYVKKALASSMMYVARNDENKIIALARYLSNDDIAYISDMVVDTGYRKKHIATSLLSELCRSIDETHSLTALISAKEGDGKDAAPSLYGAKFSFVDYSQSHQTDVMFRYIRFNPSLESHLANNSLFKVAPESNFTQQQTITTGLKK